MNKHVVGTIKGVTETDEELVLGFVMKVNNSVIDGREVFPRQFS